MIKQMKFESEFRKFIDKYHNKIFLAMVVIISFLIRIKFRSYVSGDYNYYLQPWCNEFEQYGFIDGIRKTSANYNFPYLYILAFITLFPLTNLIKIKLVSIGFDFIAAIFSYLIVKEILKDKANGNMLASFAFTLILLNPTTIMNSSIWAQCDIIYVTFILMAIYFIIKEKYTLSFIMYGISFAFKLQAIFALPIFIILYFKKKEFSIINFLIIPLINFILFIPALFMGRNMADLWNVYKGQMTQYRELVKNFSNIYRFLPNNYELFSKPAILFTILFVGIIMFFSIYFKKSCNGKDVIELLIVLLLVETYFLPSMHDRYLFMGELLVIIYVIITKKNILCASLMLIISCNSYIIYLFKTEIFSPKVAAILQLFVLFNFLREFFLGEKISNKNTIIKN